MSTAVILGTHLLHTDLGFVVVEVSQVQGYDVEDIMRNRVVSLARAVSFVNLGKAADVNAPKGARTLGSAYTNNSVELPSG